MARRNKDYEKFIDIISKDTPDSPQYKFLYLKHSNGNYVIFLKVDLLNKELKNQSTGL